VNITADMTERAAVAIKQHCHPTDSVNVGGRRGQIARAIVAAALDGYELAPFDLSEDEEALVARTETRAITTGAALKLCELVRRAQRVLVPKQAEQPRTFNTADFAQQLKWALGQYGFDVPMIQAEPIAKKLIDLYRLGPKVTCTCHTVGNLQMSAGCALHGEGDPDEEPKPNQAYRDPVTGNARWTPADVDAARSALMECDSGDEWKIAEAVLAAVAYRLAPAAPVRPEDYSDEQLSRALWCVYGSNWGKSHESGMRAALAAASVPARPGTVAMLEVAVSNCNQRIAELEAQLAVRTERVKGQDAGLAHANEYIAELEAKLAAQPAVEPLSDEEENRLQWLETCIEPDTRSGEVTHCTAIKPVVVAFRKRFPKPAPVEQTAEQLAGLLVELRERGGAKWGTALDQIVAMAKRVP
jgi:hypothetical protein